MALKEHVVVPVPPAVKVTFPLHEVVRPAGEEVEPIVTSPANWKEVVPRLVTVTRTPLLTPVVVVTLVVFATMLNPLMRIVSVASAMAVRLVAERLSR